MICKSGRWNHYLSMTAKWKVKHHLTARKFLSNIWKLNTRSRHITDIHYFRSLFPVIACLPQESVRYMTLQLLEINDTKIKFIDHRHILYIIKSRTRNFLVQPINEPTINPKNSHKDLKGVLEINSTTLQKSIKKSN